jgi:uncharacterized protein (DUF2141 family)
MKRLSLWFLGCTWVLGTAQAADLNVTFTNIEEPKGELLVAVFNSAKAWDEDKPFVTSAHIPATGSTVQHTFTQLAPGHYALSVIRDANSNQKLDTNFIGMPTEQYGYSQNPPLRMRKATFEETRFELKEADQAITVQLR